MKLQEFFICFSWLSIYSQRFQEKDIYIWDKTSFCSWVSVLYFSGYIYMHNLWFNRTEFIPIDESACSVYVKL